MSYEFEKLLRERRLVKTKIPPAMIVREIKNAEHDINRARRSYEDGDYKWAIIQAYYSMFHSIRALIYSKGYREKSHRALLAAFKELFVNQRIVESEYLKSFRDAMYLRESADYRAEYTEGGATETIENAEILLEKVRALLKR